MKTERGGVIKTQGHVTGGLVIVPDAISEYFPLKEGDIVTIEHRKLADWEPVFHIGGMIENGIFIKIEENMYFMKYTKGILELLNEKKEAEKELKWLKRIQNPSAYFQFHDVDTLKKRIAGHEKMLDVPILRHPIRAFITFLNIGYTNVELVELRLKKDRRSLFEAERNLKLQTYANTARKKRENDSGLSLDDEITQLSDKLTDIDKKNEAVDMRITLHSSIAHSFHQF